MAARQLQGIDDIVAVIADSAWHLDVLHAAKELNLNDWMIGAGFVRNAVWDHLHGNDRLTPLSDIDVIYFDNTRTAASDDQEYENQLSIIMPDVRWSIRNQARMHMRNGDQPYSSSRDAIAHWLETPTCVAVTLMDEGDLRLIAPHGVDDLLSLNVRATSSGIRKTDIYTKRIRAKNWVRTWPKLKIHFSI